MAGGSRQGQGRKEEEEAGDNIASPPIGAQLQVTDGIDGTGKVEDRRNQQDKEGQGVEANPEITRWQGFGGEERDAAEVNPAGQRQEPAAESLRGEEQRQHTEE